MTITITHAEIRRAINQASIPPDFTAISKAPPRTAEAAKAALLRIINNNCAAYYGVPNFESMTDTLATKLPEMATDLAAAPNPGLAPAVAKESVLALLTEACREAQLQPNSRRAVALSR